MKMSKFIGTAMAAIVFASGSAKADFICTSEGEIPKIGVFDLSKVDDFGFKSHDAAVIVKKGEDTKLLLSGTGQARGTRVGTIINYKLSDKQGEEADLMVSINTLFLPGPCTRASCEPPTTTKVIGAKLSLEGEQHVFTCTEQAF